MMMMKNLVSLALWFAFHYSFLIMVEGVHNCDLQCRDESQPVCGSDGKTHKNKCLLRLQKCISGGKLHVDYAGPCKVRPSCREERDQVIRNIEADRLIPMGILIPQCDDDGGYSPMQCHELSELCWCVDMFGKEIEGTRVRSKKPSCRGRSPRSHPAKSLRERYARILKGCTKEKRTSFNKKVLASFKKEMAIHLKKKGKSDATEIAEWKLRKLDTNNSGDLQHKEMKALIKKVKKAYPPRKCGKTLFFYCDKDQNDIISRTEWLSCLGVPDSSSSSTGTELSMCVKERLRTSELQRQDPNPGRFIPTCTTEGKFTAVQCQKLAKFCWCVNTETGRNIPGSAVKNGRPDCTAIRQVQRTVAPPSVSVRSTVSPRRRPQSVMPIRRVTLRPKPARGSKTKVKECDATSWARFRREFLQHFRNELESITRVRDQNSTDSGDHRNLFDIIPRRLPDRMLLSWAFSHLDTDRDRYVTNHELFTSHLRKVYGRIRRGRKCSKKLAISCNYNRNDNGLTLGEWRQCLGGSTLRSRSSFPRHKPGFLGR